MSKQTFDEVEATFSPYRTDDLHNGARAFVGQRMRWMRLWLMNEDDPFPGEWAYEPVERSTWFGWVPERDLTNVVEHESLPATTEPGAPRPPPPGRRSEQMADHSWRRPGIRRKLAWRLRFLADRLHPESAFAAVGYSLRFVEGKDAEVVKDYVSNRPKKGQRLWAIRDEDGDAWSVPGETEGM